METFPWEMTIAAVVQVAIIALLMERALAIIFEHPWFVKRLQGRGIKEILAVGVAWSVCTTWDLDVFRSVLAHAHHHRLGTILTALTVAGGSKVSQTLFELWGIRSTAAKIAANGGSK
jgi:hypothetical protein